MAFYFYNADHVARFLKNRESEPTNVDFHIEVPGGEHFVIPGVRWLATLKVEGPGSVEFPDLLLITEDLMMRNSGKLFAPKLEEIFGYVHQDSDVDVDQMDEHIEHEFDVFENFGNFETVISAPSLKFVEGVARTIAEIWDRDLIIPIANDEEYNLFYYPKNGNVGAGCQHFNSIDDAIKHWTARYDQGLEYAMFESARGGGRGGDWQTYMNRALMFVFALTNLKEAVRKNEVVYS